MASEHGARLSCSMCIRRLRTSFDKLEWREFNASLFLGRVAPLRMQSRPRDQPCGDPLGTAVGGGSQKATEAPPPSHRLGVKWLNSRIKLSFTVPDYGRANLPL